MYFIDAKRFWKLYRLIYKKIRAILDQSHHPKRNTKIVPVTVYLYLPLLSVSAVQYNTLPVGPFMILLLLEVFLSGNFTTVCGVWLTQSTSHQQAALNFKFLSHNEQNKVAE